MRESMACRDTRCEKVHPDSTVNKLHFAITKRVPVSTFHGTPRYWLVKGTPFLPKNIKVSRERVVKPTYLPLPPSKGCIIHASVRSPLRKVPVEASLFRLSSYQAKNI